MFICLDCDRVFETPRTVREHDDPKSPFEQTCPFCFGSIEEAARCELCEEFKPLSQLEKIQPAADMDALRVCEKCLEEGERYE